MSVGLLAVVDDILAATLKASAKTAGVVIDDAAVTPQYVQGVTPARELPIVMKIALGSIVNKFIIIIPIALLLTAFAPWVLPWLLIIGGTYLCYEGAEKVSEWFAKEPHGHRHVVGEPKNEKSLVFGAVRTDLILSTEIMLISLANIDGDTSNIWRTLAILAAIALLMTVIVYGAVALLVKTDDLGLKMMTTGNPRGVRRVGIRIVRAMPAVFRVISVIGTVAMLWVGGHLLIANASEVGFHFPYDVLHAIEHGLHDFGAVVVWVADTAVSAIVGLGWGFLTILVVNAIVGIAGTIEGAYRRRTGKYVVAPSRLVFTELTGENEDEHADIDIQRIESQMGVVAEIGWESHKHAWATVLTPVGSRTSYMVLGNFVATYAPESWNRDDVYDDLTQHAESEYMVEMMPILNAQSDYRHAERAVEEGRQ